MFHRPVVDAWFRRRFAEPTPVQALGWPAIAQGQDVLLTAPTGSGKTLAAFLYCLDALVRKSADGALEDRTEIVYVSPLKALSNDIRRNLEEPLGELAAVAAEMGLSAPAIRTAVRTGDTSAAERRQGAKRPPHVLVTTPESLYILLTSESGRRGLAGARTVIVDEIHAVAGDKRGAHLALSLERLEHLVIEGGGPRPQRIGLSATIRPIETAARLLVGSDRPLPALVDAGQRRDLDLAVEVLRDELGAVCTHEQWGEIYDRVAELARAHRSTLGLRQHAAPRRARDAASRGAPGAGRRRRASQQPEPPAALRRRAAPQIGRALRGRRDGFARARNRRGRGGPDLPPRLAALHRHGSPAHRPLGPRPRRHSQGPPLSAHARPAGRVRGARAGGAAGRAGPHRASPRALDVLSQQIVAACSAEEWDEDRLYALCRRAAPYADLDRAEFDAVVDMLSEGISTRRGRAGTRIHRDAVGRRLKGRRGARLAALTSGGAIPDNANYDVVLEPDETLIGTVDEDFAVESMAGDVMLLGNSSWRIRRVESGKVRVEDAAGAAPTIPFWLGEGPARTPELSAEVAAVREEVAGRLADPDAAALWLMNEGALDRRGAELARDYIAAGRAALGAVPTLDTIVAERFFDEAGGQQLIIHAPFGGRINRAWGMALRKRICQSFDFELQAAATDDGVLLSLGPQHSFPLESIFEMVHPSGVERLLTDAALQAPMFATRWRWNASRSLALLRWQGGRRVPPYLQRMRAEDLLASVFPAQLGCQDNAVGPIEIPDHPLVNETLRDCLTEAMDAEGLKHKLEALFSGKIHRVARETPEPSVFSHEILNANPYAYLDDAPLEERRARAVTLRRGLPAELADDVGRLDPEAIAAVIEEARPDLRNADELHDLLLDLGALPESEATGWTAWLDELIAAGRAARLQSGARVFWVAAERRSLALAIWPEGRLAPDVAEPPARRAAPWSDREGALVELIRARLSLVGPTTAAALAEPFGLSVSSVNSALGRVEADGDVLRGRFTPTLEPDAMEWCDRRLLARIHRRTLDRLRREIEPVSAADLMRFLFAWQHVKPGLQLHGRDGLGKIIEQLGGLRAGGGGWEREVLPARVARYEPAWLDELCLSGEIAWGRLERHASTRHAGRRLSGTVPITLLRRQNLAWLLEPRDGADEEALSAPARDVLAHLRASGASFTDEIAGRVRRLRIEVEEALCELVSAGLVTGDGFAGLRSLLHSDKA